MQCFARHYMQCVTMINYQRIKIILSILYIVKIYASVSNFSSNTFPINLFLPYLNYKSNLLIWDCILILIINGLRTKKNPSSHCRCWASHFRDIYNRRITHRSCPLSPNALNFTKRKKQNNSHSIWAKLRNFKRKWRLTYQTRAYFRRWKNRARTIILV